MPFTNREVLYAEVSWPQPQRKAGLKGLHITHAGGGRPAKQHHLVKILASGKPDVRKEYAANEAAKILDEISPAESLDLPANVKESFDVPPDAREPCCLLHTKAPCDKAKEHEINNREFLVGAVDLVLAQALDNIRGVPEDEDSAYDIFSADYVEAFLSFCGEVLKWIVMAISPAVLCSSGSGINSQ